MAGVPELEKFRAKYPDYGDMSDADLAKRLAEKYPDAYGDLPAKVGQITDSSGAVIGQGQTAPTGGPVQMDIYRTPQEKVGGAAEAVTGSSIAGSIASMATKAALPMAGQTAGRMIGAASPIPGGAMIGEAVGGGLGEAANQIAGITEPDLAQIGIAMAAGPVTRTVFAGLRMAGSTALKTFGGRTNVADVAAEVAGKMLKPPSPADELWDIAGNLRGHSVQLPKTARVVDDILREEGAALDTPASEEIIKTLRRLQPQLSGGTGIDVSALVKGTKDLRAAASAAFKSDNSRLGHAIDDVRGAMLDDAADSGFAVVAKAGNATRKEKAIEKLGGILRTSDPITKFSDALKNKNDRLFKHSFEPEELAEIKKLMQRMSTTTASGGAGIWGRSILGMFGYSAGGPVGAVATGAIPDMAAKILTTSSGRNFMGKMLLGGHLMDPAKKAEALAQFIRAQTAEDASGKTIAEAVRAALRSEATTLEQKMQARQAGTPK